MSVLLLVEAVEPGLRFNVLSGLLTALAVSCLLVAAVLVFRELAGGSARGSGSPALGVCYAGIVLVFIAGALLLAGL